MDNLPDGSSGPTRWGLSVCLSNGKPLEHLKRKEMMQDIHPYNARDTLLIDPHF